MNESIEYIAAALKAARLESGLSQRALSAKIGIPQSHLSNIENGKVDIQTSNLISIARSLGLDVMLVPFALVPALKALQQKRKTKEQIPLFRLEDQDDD